MSDRFRQINSAYIAMPDTGNLFSGDDKLATQMQSVGSQLAQMATQNEENSYNETYKNEKLIPVVTFTDDDGADDVISVLKPLFDAKNIVGCCSIITGRIGDANYMTEANLATLDSAGWEFLGHGNDYTTNLSEFSVDADLDYQLGEGCKTWLETRGYAVKGFVYPQSVSDARIRQFTKKYYDFAFAGLQINTDDRMDTMRIMRIGIGESTNPTVNGNSDSNTLNYYKTCVDYAVTNDAWLVFVTHIAATSGTQQGYLDDLIDYIQAAGVSVMTASDAHKIHGNKIFAGDVDDGTYFIVSKNGRIYSSENIVTPLAANSFAATDLITSYPANAISVMPVHSPGTAGFPIDASGVAITYRLFGTGGYDYQLYQRVSSHETYIRRTAVGGAWGAWEQTNLVYVSVANEYSLNTIPSGFRLGITYCAVSGTNATWATLPMLATGILVTYKLSQYGYETYQEYLYRNSHVKWYRSWDPVNLVWGNWYRQWIEADTTANRPTNNFLGMQYYDITLGKQVNVHTAGVKEKDTLTLSAGAVTGSGNITITLNGSAVTVAVVSGDTIAQVDAKIRATAFTGWVVSGAAGSGVIVFWNTATGACSAPTFVDTGTTGVAGSFARTVTGVTTVWHDGAGSAV